MCPKCFLEVYKDSIERYLGVVVCTKEERIEKVEIVFEEVDG
jgi:hypothetical protein